MTRLTTNRVTVLRALNRRPHNAVALANRTGLRGFEATRQLRVLRTLGLAELDTDGRYRLTAEGHALLRTHERDLAHKRAQRLQVAV